MRVVCAVHLAEDVCLLQRKFKGAELSREQVDDGGDTGGRQEDGVNAMNHTIGAEDVDGYKTAVEVDRGALERDANSEALRMPEVLAGCVESWNGV